MAGHTPVRSGWCYQHFAVVEVGLVPPQAAPPTPSLDPSHGRVVRPVAPSKKSRSSVSVRVTTSILKVLGLVNEGERLASAVGVIPSHVDQTDGVLACGLFPRPNRRLEESRNVNTRCANRVLHSANRLPRLVRPSITAFFPGRACPEQPYGSRSDVGLPCAGVPPHGFS